MTSISKRIATWILGALAFVALSFGVVFTMPQVKTAKAADTAVTFSAELDGFTHDTYGTSICFNTSGLQWETYHNWVAAADWVSISDYTTVNGRTVTEINNAHPDKQPVTLMMQPAGSYSFLRLYIPADIMPLADVKSMGILDGWSFNNGTNNYTSSAVTFLRTGNTMVLASNYTEVAKVTPTISTAVSGYRTKDSVGGDSWVVSIDLGTGATYGEYDLMYDGYKNLRNAIYINGKSIEEWNTQAIAENPALGDPSTYLVFPQNSVDSDHPKWFAKPVGLWGNGTDDVVKLTIHKSLVADVKEIVVKVGAGAYVAGQLMVAENVSNTVHTQTTEDITSKIQCMTNTINETQGYAVYYIFTGNSTAFWTASAKHGGCLGEEVTGKGGQSLLKFVEFNGTSVWDINAGDDGAYDSTQGNIANGGVYAPIFADLTAEVGGTIKLIVPLHFAGLDENGVGISDADSALVDNHYEIVLKRGLSIYDPTTGISSYLTNDIVFTNTTGGVANNTRWTKEVKGNEIATEVTGIVTKANRTDGGNNENFVIFQLSNNDYASCDTTAITDISSLFGYIDIGGTVIESYSGEKFFNVWGVKNSVAFRFADVATLQNIPYITIKAGAKFPSYNTQNGAPLTYYVTSEDITFIHDVPNDTWTVGTLVNEYTVTYTVDGETYHTETVSAGNTATAPSAPTKAEDETYTYTFDCWTLNGVEYDFNTAVESDITLVAKFTATKKPSTVDITAGLSFSDQGNTQKEGTDTYLIKTSGLAWTNTGTGRINIDYPEALDYIYFNGRSIAEINKESDEAFGSSFEAITGDGECAPIAVLYNQLSETSSYLQIWVPTGYPNEGATAEQNHQSIEIKAGFSITQDVTTWTVTEDIKWVQLNGSWVNANTTFSSYTVEIRNPRIDGTAKELYKVDITSSSWNITCNNYDFMYGGQYEGFRKFIFINGVSIYDINANTDDSSYVYSSSPMTGNDDDLFAHPVLIETHNQNDDPHTITLWMHKDYIDSLDGEIVVTLGAGYGAYTNGLVLDANVDYKLKFMIEVDDGTNTLATPIFQGATVESLGVPTKAMTATTRYIFEGWYDENTNTKLVADTVITADMRIEARYTEKSVDFINTEISFATYYVDETVTTNRWFYFTLTEHDFPVDVATYNVGSTAADGKGIEYAKSIGLFDKITIKGKIILGGTEVSEATLAEIGAANGYGEAVYMNIWDTTSYFGTIAFRTLGVESITEMIVEEGALFPSYEYVSACRADENTTVTETYFKLAKTVTATNNNVEGLNGVFLPEKTSVYDIQMSLGAAVRITSDMETSGIRFETQILKSDLVALELAVNGQNPIYDSVEFGTIIVPKDFLMGGMLTHSWLDNNGLDYIDITSSAGIDNIDEWPIQGDYYSYFGSIVKLKEANYGRDFIGLGYIYIQPADGSDAFYIYANYDSTNSRSASFIANAAINDRRDTQDDEYKHLTENNNYSPYTSEQRTFLADYLVWSNSAIGSQVLDELANQGGTKTITPTTQKLAGPYVELVYSTNVNVKGVFTYTDGSKTANEEFYLQAGTTSHKQYLDIFRYNGVGYGMDTSNLSMTSIKFTNAELEAGTAGEVKVFGLYSQMKTIDMANQEIYLTVAQDDGSEMTVGAHLGIGGALTYLAKSGIYEGVIGGSSGWKDGTVALSTSTSSFDSINRYKSGSSSSSYSEEAGYYGHATSSKPSDGAVNLINNFDAGRQIQQSWYAQVGGSDSATDGSNGYNRAYCYTGSTEGQYWPYNPVQAGDVVSNPGQIIDYEVNEAKGYIYVKARAMDWAKGYDASRPCENAVEGGVTTQSYMENYYRLGTDGTVTVNNSFIDWNGFTDMESCDWASTELPAVYPVHTLNYYVSNVGNTNVWADGDAGLTYKNDMEAWTGGTAYHQFANASQGDTKVEDWFAWANGGDGNAIGLGMYIPNVNRYTSGRSNTSTAYYTDVNFQNSNALPVDDYKTGSIFNKVSQVSALAQRGNILAAKGMMSNMQEIKYTYQSAYVSNTSYTAPGVDFRMEAYVPIEYTYVLCVDTVTNIRNTFKAIKEKGTVTNAGADGYYQKVGLDAWARADKKWTW